MYWSSFPFSKSTRVSSTLTQDHLNGIVLVSVGTPASAAVEVCWSINQQSLQSENWFWKSFISCCNLLTWDRRLRLRLLFVFDGRVPQRVVGKRTQERRAADTKTNTSHTNCKWVCWNQRIRDKVTQIDYAQYKNGVALNKYTAGRGIQLENRLSQILRI